MLTVIVPINGFFWEVGSSDTPIQDDPTLEDYNVDYIVDLFVNETIQQAEGYRAVWMLFTCHEVNGIEQHYADDGRRLQL